MEREYREINPQVWKPESNGDSVEGTFVGTKKDVGVNKSHIHNLMKEDYSQVSVWGSTILDDRMEYIKPGQYVRITYKGTEQNKRGQPVKLFKVEVADKKQQQTVTEESVV